MKIKEIIDFLRDKDISYVNWNQSKDRILFGNIENETKKVVVAWVATMEVIKKAIREKANFIITHENLFYENSTNSHILIEKMQREKIKLLEENNITVYRCHDLWDLYPEIGVRDTWQKNLDLKKVTSEKFYSFGSLKEETTAFKIAEIISKKIAPYGQKGVQIIGDKNKKVKNITLGTGAVSKVTEMIKEDTDLLVVTDDGINNWIDVQLAMDMGLALLSVSHYISEVQGIENLNKFLQNKFSEVEFIFEKNNYGIENIV